MPEREPPAEHEISGQQRRDLIQPRRRAIRVAGIQTRFSEVLEGGDGQLDPALGPAERQRLEVVIKRLLGRPKIAEHPASEIDCAASEPRHLTAVDFGRVLSEGGEGSGPVPGQSLRHGR